MFERNAQGTVLCLDENSVMQCTGDGSLCCNFEVEDFHTYYVGDSSILVHNVCGAKNTPNQNAVIQLAKENKNGLSLDDAKILVEWAKEYGLNNHGPMTHPNRSGIWSFTEHVKIFNEHIPII